MSDKLLQNQDYKNWLKALKQKVRQAQLKTAVQVNTALLEFYWGLGADIVERQKTAKWGSGFLQQLSQDLMAEFPEMQGFSFSNLKYVRPWYLFYEEAVVNSGTSCSTISQQAVGQLADGVQSGNSLLLDCCRFHGGIMSPLFPSVRMWKRHFSTSTGHLSITGAGRC